MTGQTIQLAWPTPIRSTTHDNPALDEALVAAAHRITDETAEDGAYFFSRRKVNCFSGFNEKALLDLGRLTFSSIREYLHLVYGDEPAPRLELSGWPMIQPYGHGVPAHHHIGSHLVAIYYCSVPPVEQPPIRDSGHIVLHDPRPANRDWEPIASRSREYKYLTMAVHAGMMLIFPGYVMHSVQPWFGRTPRVCFAMNVMVHRKRTEEPSVSEADLEAAHA